MALFPIVLWGVSWAVVALSPAASIQQQVASHDTLEQSMEFAGGDIHWQRVGRGEPTLVFVHGWACESSSFREQLGRFSGTSLALDLPGHGQSSAPDDLLTVDLMVDAILAVLDHENIDAAILVGHSNGAVVCLRLCHQVPDRVRALVTIEGTLQRPPWSDAQLDAMAQPLETAGYKETVRGMFAGMLPNQLPDAVRDDLIARAAGTSQQTLLESLRAIHEPKIWSAKRLDMPMLAVFAKSPFWTDEFFVEVEAMADDVTLHVLDERSHFLMLEEHGRPFNELLNAFLQQISKSTSSDVTEPDSDQSGSDQ